MNASADINDPNRYLVTSTENVEGKALADKLENVLYSGEKVHGIPAIHPEHNRADYEANKTKIDGQEDGKVVNVIVIPDTTPGLYVHPVVFARKDDKVYFTDPR